MVASKVAQWKIDKIANTLANKSYNERIKAVVECGKKIVEDFYRKQIPEEILVLWEKYKDKGVFNERSGWYLYYHNNKGNINYSWQYNLSLPEYPSTSLKEDKEVLERICVYGDQYQTLKKEKEVFRKELICTLETLKTHAKIRDNFPEAFVLLQEIEADEQDERLEMQNKQKENLCDSVENLRAQLNHNIQNEPKQDQN